jgi:hypothetical protein
MFWLHRTTGALLQDEEAQALRRAGDEFDVLGPYPTRRDVEVAARKLRRRQRAGDPDRWRHDPDETTSTWFQRRRITPDSAPLFIGSGLVLLGAAAVGLVAALALDDSALLRMTLPFAVFGAAFALAGWASRG